MSEIIKYLSSFVNRKENVQELLKKLLYSTDFEIGTIFIYTTKFILLEHCEKSPRTSNEELTINFNTDKRIKNIFFINLPKDNIYYHSDNFETRNILIIPIFENLDFLGVMCLVNLKESIHYSSDLLEKITPFMSLLQLILKKHLLSLSNTNLSNDFFLANISHEIRTPLNGIIGYNQLLMQTSLNNVQKEYLSSMNKCSVQLMQIISDILDFSKLACGKMNINEEYFSIKDVIEQIKDVINNQIYEKKQKLSFTVEDNVPTYIIADKQKLLQILINLITNSCKFTDISGFISVFIKAVLKEETKDYTLECLVKDNGIGIKKEDLVNIFDSFIQVNSSNKLRSGSGLGLFICKKLIQLLGGDIIIDSEFGHGTTVKFSLKFKLYDDFEKHIKKDIKILKDKYILIVDDNADNRIFLSEILFDWKMKPIICASALEALRMVMGNRYKLCMCLIDICMPVISGSELAKQIKEEKPFLPLVALSSLDSFVNYQDFEKKIDKPIDKVELFNTIHTIIIKNRDDDSESFSSYDSDSSDQNKKYEFNKNCKILLVEDIDYNKNLIINMLESIEYKNIYTAENGKDALEMLEKGNYDILILDLILPIVDGYEVLKNMNNIVNNNPLFKQPKIMVTTASVIEETKIACKKLGVKHFVDKPIDFKKFKKIILEFSIF